MKIKLIDYGLKKWPERAHYNDAGLDVFACLVKRGAEGEFGKVKVWNNSSTKVPLGFGVEIPDGYVGFICPRSGLSSRGITCELSPIDSGYRGEIHTIVTNNTNTDFWIEDGDKIGQLVIVPCVLAELVKPGELGKERETGAFGSTGGK